MTLKANWESGDTYSADDANAVAVAVNRIDGSVDDIIAAKGAPSGYASLDASGVIIPSQLPGYTYTVTIGNGTATTYEVAHGLGTRDVMVQVWELATGVEVNTDITRTSIDAATLTFATAPGLNAYRVVVFASGNTGVSIGGGGEGGGGTSSPDWSVTTLSSAGTLLAVAGFTYIVLLSGATAAPQLPTAVGNSSRYILKNVHTNDRTVTTTSSQGIEGQPTLVLSSGASVELVSDGASWRII